MVRRPESTGAMCLIVFAQLIGCLQTNFDARDYTGETIPPLTGKTREEVKTTLKSERIKQASGCLAGAVTVGWQGHVQLCGGGLDSWVADAGGGSRARAEHTQLHLVWVSAAAR